MSAPATQAGPRGGPQRVLVALGGNAMTGADGRATEADQIAALTEAARHIATLVAAGVEVAITHGNGPQVGNLLVKNELSAAVVPPVPLDWCVAQTQATIGFVLVNALEHQFAARGIARRAVPLVTRTLVDEDDVAFHDPVKPVGRYVDALEAVRFTALGQQWRDFGAKGWRRVVASPSPQQILDADVARTLVRAGVVVICAGGGGIPVVRDPDGALRGIEAVVDKDLAAGLLAEELDCDTLVIATDVSHAVLGHGTGSAADIGEIDPDTLAGHHAAGEFGAGSMAPKVAAAQRFAAKPGRTSIITSLEFLAAAVTDPRGEIATVVRHRSAIPPHH